MKQILKIISPKRLFGSKKGKNLSTRSDPATYSYGAASASSSSSSDESSSSGFHNKKGTHLGTPTSVLNHSGDWTDLSSDMFLDPVQAFKLIDRDNDGIVSRIELESLLSRLGADPPSQEEVDTMLKEVDPHGEGCISIEALTNRIGSVCEPAGGDELRVCFEFFDTDHDGKITAEELVEVFKALGDDRCTLDDCRRMIAEVDKNGDGFVCFEDFARMMELQR